MEHNALTFDALKTSLQEAIALPNLAEHPFLAGMGNRLIKTDKGFLCSPEFFEKAKANLAALMQEDIDIIEISSTAPSSTRQPDYSTSNYSFWKL